MVRKYGAALKRLTNTSKYIVAVNATANFFYRRLKMPEWLDFIIKVAIVLMFILFGCFQIIKNLMNNK